MLAPAVFSRLPLASADSTNAAQNHAIDQKWRGAYAPPSPQARVMVLADRIEHHGSAPAWVREFGHQTDLEFAG